MKKQKSTKVAEFPLESMESLDFAINSNEVREIIEDLIYKLIYKYKQELAYEVLRGNLNRKNLTTDILRDTVAEEIKHSPEPYNTIVITLEKELGKEKFDNEVKNQIEKKIYDHVYSKIEERDLEDAMKEIEEYLNSRKEAKKMSRLKKVADNGKYNMIYEAFETADVKQELKRSFEKHYDDLIGDLSRFNDVDDFVDKLIEEVCGDDEPYNSVAIYLSEAYDIPLDDDSFEADILSITEEKVDEMLDEQVYEVEEKIEKFKSENESDDGESQEYWNSRF